MLPDIVTSCDIPKIEVDAKNSSRNFWVDFNSGILKFVFNLDYIMASEFVAADLKIEQIFGLRRTREDSVFEEGDKVIQTEANPLSKLGKKFDVSVDWESLRNVKEFIGTHEPFKYVTTARKFAKFLGHVLCTGDEHILREAQKNSFLKVFQFIDPDLVLI